MFRKKRVKYAAKFGRIEHKFGRLIPYPLALGIVYCSYTSHYPELIMFIIGTLFWLTYLTAHTIEKKLYGHFGPRG